MKSVKQSINNVVVLYHATATLRKKTADLAPKPWDLGLHLLLSEVILNSLRLNEIEEFLILDVDLVSKPNPYYRSKPSPNLSFQIQIQTPIPKALFQIQIGFRICCIPSFYFSAETEKRF